MKWFAFLSIAFLLLTGGTPGRAESHADRQAASHNSASPGRFLAFIAGNALAPLLRHSAPSRMLDQTSGTATPAANLPTPTATTTPTTPTYPDPQTVLTDRDTAYAAVKTVQFDEGTALEQPNVEKATIDAKGNATCARFALKAHATGKDTLENTGETATVNKYLVEIGTRAYELSKKTHSKWAKVTQSELETYAYNPLACTPATGGSGSVVVKDLADLGPDTFQGKPVWHIRATLIDTSSNTTATADYLVGQDNYLPYKSTVTLGANQANLTGGFDLVLSKFGEKFSVKTPKIGSKKP